MGEDDCGLPFRCCVQVEWVLFAMPDILLTTLNAKYIHSSFGLRYLMANLGDLKPRAEIVEFTINQRSIEIIEELVKRRPGILGFGVYIWNTVQTLEVVKLVKKVLPNTIIVIGGPEVSFEWEDQEIVRLADYLITGEADLKFAEVCRAILDGSAPTENVIVSPLPDMEELSLPYELYDDNDVRTRVLYVEASRGCPFTCEFCLSSLDVPVRQVSLERLLPALDRLLERGVQQFKFVDRTFNLNINVSQAILAFFHERFRPGLFLHFEMIPDRLPEALREMIAQFPPGALQFEVGIQSFDPEVGRNISRRQNFEKLAENFHYLRRETGVHIHADLIVGLPGESVEMFAAGFDRLVALDPQEIQVGILKRLRGTPIARHDGEFGMVYSPSPPYEILQNQLIDFDMMSRMRRFARFWDLTANSGNFSNTYRLIWSTSSSPFEAFFKWSEWLFETVKRTSGIAKFELAKRLFEFLTEISGVSKEHAAESLWRDLRLDSPAGSPKFLRPYIEAIATVVPSTASLPASKRQARHLTST